MDDAILEDAFMRGFHDIPDDDVLRTMSPLQLHELLSRRGSTPFPRLRAWYARCARFDNERSEVNVLLISP